MGEQLIADAVALCSEREDCGGWHADRVERVAFGVNGDELTPMKSCLGCPGDRDCVVQTGCAPENIWLPWILAPCCKDRCDIRCGGNANAGAHIAQVAGVLEQHYRSWPRGGEDSVYGDLWTSRDC